MDLLTQREIAKRTLGFLDDGTTDLAPGMYEEPIESYISEDVYRREIEAVFSRFPLFVGMSSDSPSRGRGSRATSSGRPCS